MTIDQQRGIYRNIMLILYWEGWAESVETLLLRHRWNSNMNINTHILAGIRCALYIFINVTNTWNTVWNSEAWESLPQCACDETLPGFLDACSAASAQRIQSLHLSSFTHSPGCLPHNHCSILQPSVLRECPPKPTVQIKWSKLPLPLWRSLPTFPCKPSLLCLIKSSFRAISCSLCLHLSTDCVISLQGPWHFMFLVCFEMQMSFWSLFC